MKENREIRKMALEIRAIDDSRKIEGYAIKFNELSDDLGGFKEKIVPEALDGVIEKSDIFALMDHEYGKVLARSRFGVGSLQLEIDEIGLKYSFEAPKTDLGDELLEHIRRGEMYGSSFAFGVEDDNWERQEDDTYIRTILKIGKLYDVSPVYEPAYQNTSVECKRFAEIQEAERQENEKRMQEEAKKAELRKYFEELRNDISNISIRQMTE